MTKRFVYFVALLTLSAINIFPQNSGLIAQNSRKKCAELVNGKLINNPQPIYPTEAKIAGINGKVEIAVEIDESGNVTSVESLNGDDLFKKSASEAAFQARFSASLCDGVPIKNRGVITFNYPKIALTSEYFKPAKLEDFPDVTTDKFYYEAVSLLTTDYRIAFGYVDQKFHGEMPLTRGDFAHFLRQTLDMLEWKGKLAQKPIRKIGLYQAYNPHKLAEFEFAPNLPFTESLTVLSDKYGIVLAGMDGSFVGETPMTRAEINKIWRGIFGEDAVPIHFLDEKDFDKEMTRGDFAVYLKESLDVLSYKVLP